MSLTLLNISIIFVLFIFPFSFHCTPCSPLLLRLLLLLLPSSSSACSSSCQLRRIGLCLRTREQVEREESTTLNAYCVRPSSSRESRWVEHRRPAALAALPPDPLTLHGPSRTPSPLTGWGFHSNHKLRSPSVKPRIRAGERRHLGTFCLLIQSRSVARFYYISLALVVNEKHQALALGSYV